MKCVFVWKWHWMELTRTTFFLIVQPSDAWTTCYVCWKLTKSSSSSIGGQNLKMLYLHNNKRRDLSFRSERRRKNIYKHREHPPLSILDPFSANSSQQNKIIIWAEESHPFFFENPFIIIIILYNKSIMFRQEHPKWFSRNLSEWKINKHKREEEEGERKKKKIE